MAQVTAWIRLIANDLAVLRLYGNAGSLSSKTLHRLTSLPEFKVYFADTAFGE